MPVWGFIFPAYDSTLFNSPIHATLVLSGPLRNDGSLGWVELQRDVTLGEGAQSTLAPQSIPDGMPAWVYREA